MGVVKQKIDGRKTVYCKGDYWDGNPAYKSYNSRKTNSLLHWEDLGVRSTPRRRK